MTRVSDIKKPPRYFCFPLRGLPDCRKGGTIYDRCKNKRERSDNPTRQVTDPPKTSRRLRPHNKKPLRTEQPRNMQAASSGTVSALETAYLPIGPHVSHTEQSTRSGLTPGTKLTAEVLELMGSAVLGSTTYGADVAGGSALLSTFVSLSLGAERPQ